MSRVAPPRLRLRPRLRFCRIRLRFRPRFCRIRLRPRLRFRRVRLRLCAVRVRPMKTGTFFLNEPDGFEEQHEWLGYDRFYDLIEGCETGVCMNSWFNDIADDVTPLRHVGL
jgi:hypothetical protein